MTHTAIHTEAHHPRRIALFGGSFDPIHVGHLAVARAAERRFHLDEIHFIPSGRPPHKHEQKLAPYPHRFAMVALACSEHPAFVPSLAEAGAEQGGREICYSIDTVRRFKARHRNPVDELFFIVGADSFLEIPTWREYETLLLSCDFVVASRPGFRMSALRLVIPPELLARPRHLGAGARVAATKTNGHTVHADSRTIELRRSTVHVMDTVECSVSATDVRKRLARGHSIHGLVPARVEEYICKQNLYGHP